MNKYKSGDKVVLNFSDKKLAKRYNGNTATVISFCENTGGERYRINCDSLELRELRVEVIRAEDLAFN